jgi:hypothetical protein
LPQEVNNCSVFARHAAALVYQGPDWPCFIKAIELNAGSIYGDLVIAQGKSTP